MKVDPRELTELAESCLTASTDLARQWQDGVVALEVAAGAAGSSAGGAALLAAHAATADAAGVAVGRLVATLEQTMDGLYACAFDMSSTDEAEATRYEGALNDPWWPFVVGAGS